MLAPTSAHAQDASALVVLSAPPFLLAALVTGFVRHIWIRRVAGSPPSVRSALALGAFEFFLWLLAAWCVVLVYFQEEWSAAVGLVGVLAIIVTLNRRLAAPKRSWRLSAALAGLFPATWFLIQSIWYGVVLLGQ